MFYIKAKDLEERTRLISYLKEHGVLAVYHYIPLHTAPASKDCGKFHGEDCYTTKVRERMVRRPMKYGLKEEEIEYITEKVKEFYQ